MSKFKAVIDFSGYSAPELAPVAQTIHDGMAGHATLFAAPPVTLATLQSEIADFLAKLAARASRAIDDAIAFNIARHTLEETLSQLGDYVNTVARGDQATVAASGFPNYDTARTAPNTAPPAPPTGLSLRHGDLSGTIVARYHPARARSINEVQTNPGDPNVETGWGHAGMFSGGRATVGNLTPASTVWVRVRTVGLKGVMGAWSDSGKIIVV